MISAGLVLRNMGTELEPTTAPGKKYRTIFSSG